MGDGGIEDFAGENPEGAAGGDEGLGSCGVVEGLVEGFGEAEGAGAGGGGFEGFAVGDPKGGVAIGEGFEGWNGESDTVGGSVGDGRSVPVCETVMYQGCRSIAPTR